MRAQYDIDHSYLTSGADFAVDDLPNPPQEVVPMHHQPSVATHTVELLQLHEINDRLARNGRVFTAAELGATRGEAAYGQEQLLLPPTAVLTGLSWDGPPLFPYIHAHFVLDGRGEPMLVEMHSAALREISHLLGLRHVWGA